jgi:hypothetical protein
VSWTTIRHSGVPENTETATWRVGEKPHDPLDPCPYGVPGWRPDPRRGRRRRGELPDAPPVEHFESMPGEHRESRPVERQGSMPGERRKSVPGEHRSEPMTFEPRESTPGRRRESRPVEHRESIPGEGRQSRPVEHHESRPRESRSGERRESRPVEHRESIPFERGSEPQAPERRSEAQSPRHRGDRPGRGWFEAPDRTEPSRPLTETEDPQDFSPLREAAYRDFLRDSEELHLAHLEPPAPNRVLVYLRWYLQVVVAILYWRVVPFPESPSRCRRSRTACHPRQSARYVGRAVVAANRVAADAAWTIADPVATDVAWWTTGAATETSPATAFGATDPAQTTRPETEISPAAPFAAADSIGTTWAATEGDRATAFVAAEPIATTSAATETSPATAFGAADPAQTTRLATETGPAMSRVAGAPIVPRPVPANPVDPPPIRIEWRAAARVARSTPGEYHRPQVRQAPARPADLPRSRPSLHPHEPVQPPASAHEPVRPSAGPHGPVRTPARPPVHRLAVMSPRNAALTRRRAETREIFLHT